VHLRAIEASNDAVTDSSSDGFSLGALLSAAQHQKPLGAEALYFIWQDGDTARTEDDPWAREIERKAPHVNAFKFASNFSVRPLANSVAARSKNGLEDRTNE
jgi:hypothetical protein